jgi:hypothetical protein
VVAGEKITSIPCSHVSDAIQDNGHRYLTLHRVALNFLPCQALSVPCEQLFSGGGEIVMKRRAQLGAAWFEELQ